MVLILRRIGRLVVRRPRLVLALAAIVAVLAAVAGIGIESHLTSGGLHDPSSESVRAATALEREFSAGPPNFVLLARVHAGDVDSPAAVRAGRALTAHLAAEPGLDTVASYWQAPTPSSPLRSRDGTAALVVGHIRGGDAVVQEVARDLAARYDGAGPVLDLAAGGQAIAIAQTTDQSKKDLQTAELVTLPVTAILLFVIFGGLLAALLPLAVGGVAILGTLLVLRLLSMVTGVSIFALNITTALGLGLAIDYSLLVLSRYREERGAGRDLPLAMVRTLQTAGRTVIFSACTVALSMLAMLVFPLGFLRSLAYAGTGVVIVAALAAVLVLPALLVLLGDRVLRPDKDAAADRPGFWYRRTRAVMRRPVLWSVAALTLLVVAGIPFLSLRLGDSDERGLPSSTSAYQVGQAIRAEFPSDASAAISVVAPTLPSGGEAQVAGYALDLSRIPSVLRVESAAGIYTAGRQVSPPAAATQRYARPGATWLQVVPVGDPLSATAEQAASAVRAAPAPFPVLVGGTTLLLADDRKALTSRLAIVFPLIAVTTFILLFLLVGSLLVPAKALVLNMLSLSATFGALVWIFQEGHLAGSLGATATGTIPYAIPMFLFGIAFGLSMDYEVFLLSRIKEEYDETRDNDEAVARGLDHTGGIVTAAALLVAVVFSAFATAGVTVVKIIGVGIALAVLVDAFVIRATLVPALMRLAGRANWWAPRSVRRLHLLIGFWEQEPIDVLEVARGRAPGPDDERSITPFGALRKDLTDR